MAVKCATCSEDFLGAVNRCWKCGAYVTLNLEAFQTPPVRRAPVVLRAKAKVAEAAAASATSGSTAPTLATGSKQAPSAGRKRGNPFASEVEHAVFVPAASEAMANELAAEKGVWIGLVVAALTWILAFVFPPAAIVTAIVAIGLAIWGLSSRQKAFAGALIVLCVIGFVVSGYQCAIWGYNMLAPEFTPAEVEEDF